MPILRNSERRSLKRCPQQWWWGWREGLVSRSSNYDARWFGFGIHLALAEWYKGPGLRRGRPPVETWMAYSADALAHIRTTDTTEEDAARYTDVQTLGRVLMEEYVVKYGRDEHKLIISPEQTFRLEVPWPTTSLYEVPSGAILAEMVGTFDNVWRHATSGHILLDEHKTAKTVSTQHLAIDDQGGTYWAVAERTLKTQGLIKPRERVRGIEYNFIRKALPDDRPRDSEGYACNKPTKGDYISALQAHLGLEPFTATSVDGLRTLAEAAGLVVLGERSKIQHPPLFVRHMVHRTSAERATQLRRIQDEALYAQVLRDGLLPVILNPTRDCRWDCDFFAMCELKEASGNWQEFRKLQYKARDPYADHRKSTEE